MQFKFLGTATEIYPTVLVANENGDRVGLTAEPGEVYELTDPVSLPRLVPDDDEAIAHAAAEAEKVAAMEAEVGLERPPEGTIAEVTAWVGEDRGRAAAALAAESVRPHPRKSLVDALTSTVQKES